VIRQDCRDSSLSQLLAAGLSLTAP
jgi:hypothetical protein